MDNETNDKFYGYYNNKPILFVIVTFLVVSVSIIGFIMNSTILLVKFSRRQERNGAEILVLNLIFMMIVTSILMILFLIDEVFYEAASGALCLLREFLDDFSVCIKMLSFISLIIVLSSHSNIDNSTGKWMTLAMWIIALIISFPRYTYHTISVELSDSKIRHVCAPSFIEDESGFDFASYMEQMAFLKYFIPSITVILLTIWIIVTRRLSKIPKNNRNLLLYSITVANFFCILKIPTGFFEGYIYEDYEELLGLAIWIAFLCDSVIIISPIAYCYFEREIFVEIYKIFSEAFGNDQEDNSFVNPVTEENINVEIN